MWPENTLSFSWLVALQLLVAVCANVYLLRATSQRRFPVHWDTFLVVLRLSGIIDLSFSVVVAVVVIWSSLMVNGDTLTVSCACYTLDQMLLASAVVVVGGVVVCCRQAFVLVLFNDEEPLFRENRFRVVRLQRAVCVVAVVAVVMAAVARCLLPSFDVSVCFVVGTALPRAGYLLVLPVLVHVGLGVVFVAQAKCPDTGRKQSPSGHIDVSCEKLVEHLSPTAQDGHTKLSDSRWKRFILVVNVGVITWFIVGTGIVVAGVHSLPPSGGTLVLVSGCTAACSVWSAVSVFRYWT